MTRAVDNRERSDYQHEICGTPSPDDLVVGLTLVDVDALGAALVTKDENLRSSETVPTVW